MVNQHFKDISIWIEHAALKLNMQIEQNKIVQLTLEQLYFKNSLVLSLVQEEYSLVETAKELHSFVPKY